jgi:hypothetical protein
VVEVHVNLAKCPFCHDEVAVADRAVCAACLAVHHLECWTEHGACSACAGEQVLTMQTKQKDKLGARIEQLADDDAIVRRWAAYSLRKATPRERAAIPALCQALHDDDRWTRMWAALALSGIGPLAAKAADRLETLANDAAEHERVREAAAKALKRVRGKKGS